MKIFFCLPVTLLFCESFQLIQQHTKDLINPTNSGGIKPTGSFNSEKYYTNTMLLFQKSIFYSSNQTSFKNLRTEILIKPSSLNSSWIFSTTVNLNASSSMSIKTISSIEPSTIAASTVTMYSSFSPFPTYVPKPYIIIKCGEECENLKKHLYTAATFAVLFLVVSVVLVVLLYRQYRIAQDYSDDPSLSRLI